MIGAPHPERDRLAREARIAPLLAQVFLTRGISTAAGVREFLHPDFRNLLPPAALPGAELAAEKLLDAIQQRRRIVIYGDYDVDGVSATAILWQILTLAGADVAFYIPSRLDEGYGLNAEALRRLSAEGARLVITVDCGITAIAEAELARELGLELIITDHHQPRERLPAAAVIVHPTACGESPNPHLCGAAVALKVAWALVQRLHSGGKADERFRAALVEATAFAALGLIADVAPLVGENRLIASFGLRQLGRVRNVGLRELLEVSGLAGKERMDDYDIGFLLAPRLNAVGRMGHAQLAVELFTRATPEQAREIALALDAANRKRQEVERGILRDADEQVRARGFDREGCRAIVLGSDQWHPGVIGIVAARLVDRYCRPTVLIALENGLGQGSGRSIRHFPLHEALAECAAHLVSHGGHAMAAGLKLRSSELEPFALAFQARAGARLTSADITPRLNLEDVVTLDELTEELVEPLLSMAPFGAGNARPLFATSDVELVDAPRVVGKNAQHLQITIRQPGANGRASYRKAIAFGMADCAAELNDCRRLQLAFEPIFNEWQGRRSVELRVVDWRPA